MRLGLYIVAGMALVASTAQATTLTQALESAYTTNPQILAERQRLEQVDEGVSRALSGMRPTVTARYTQGRQKTSFDSADSQRSDYQEKSISLSQPLFRGGGTWAGYHAARQQVKAGQYQLTGTEQQVMLDSVTAYADVAAGQSTLALALENQKTLEKQVNAVKERFAVGEVTRTDVAQSESRLSNAKSQRIAAEGSVLSANAAFERVVGLAPEGTLAMPKTLPELPATLAEALDQGRGQNPQLLAAEHTAKSASFTVDGSMATLLPQVSLTGSMSRQEGAGSFGNSRFDQDRIGIEVSIPLYRSGAEYSRIREAKSAARERKHQTTDTQHAVIEQVTQSWERLETAVATIQTRKDQIAAATVSLDGVREEQQSGSRTVLDVLDAEQELFNARTALVRAERDRVVAAYTLAMHLGLLTPQRLELTVTPYDAQEHYDGVKWQPIGF